jgi:peptidoglycan endopeptidase LytE
MKKKIMAGALVTTFMFSGQAFASDYIVKSGDSLWKIANNNEISINELKTWNSLSTDVIYPGQSLKVTTPKVQAPTSTSSNGTYTIKSGDSLSAIAKNHQITLSQLLSLNPAIKDVNRIYVGQKITVPTKSAPATSTPSQPAPVQQSSTYTIKSGDSLSLVAQRHQITLAVLMNANPSIKDANRIYIGQVITIPGAGQAVPVSGDAAWQTKANAIIESGKKYLGAGYLYGASTTRTDAFDCSSYTLRVFQENGINLPRTSAQQANVGKEVPLSQVRKGDLVFFDTDGNGTINHVSIVVDATTILHSATTTGVAYATMNTYWKPRAVKAVRVF